MTVAIGRIIVRSRLVSSLVGTVVAGTFLVVPTTPVSAGPAIASTTSRPMP